MDPVSQGAFGALFAGVAHALNKKRSQSFEAEKRVPSRKLVLGVGALAGMAPDLDVFISSSVDPLLSLEFHRHFTHSLFFIPFGALICATLFWLFVRRRFSSFSELYVLCLAAISSHGLLDSFTSYGTQLFWPFSNYRVAWDSMSIIDPLFTLPLIFLLLSKVRHSVFVALTFAFFYLGLGFVQRDRAVALVAELAQNRGHEGALRIQAKPSLGNQILFRGIYEFDGRYYADAIRVPLWGKVKVYQGTSLPKVDLNSYADIKDSVLYDDIKRFAWFSDNFLAIDPRDFTVVGDFRYSMLPNTVEPMWGIRVDTARKDRHTEFVTIRNIEGRPLGKLWQMILGR
jgi:inner membrane protein